MHPIDTIQRWAQRIDRERTRSFLLFLWKRFLDDNCFQTAGSLSYTTLLAIVPLSATVLGVVAMFPLYQHWGDALTSFLFHNFVPKAAASAADYVRAFASTARSLSGFAALALLFTSLLTMSSIEDAFNRIWRVPAPRRWLARVMVYVAALAFGPLLAVSSLAISSYLFSLPFIAAAEQATILGYGLRLSPIVMELIAFGAAYKIIPNRTVRWRHAFIGGFVATLLFEIAKFAIAYYLTRASYQKIYGALALMPIFLLWIWVSWLVVLLGATLASALSTFDYQPVALRLPKGFELYGLLRLLGRFAQAHAENRGLHLAELDALEPCLTDDLMQRMLCALLEMGVIRRDDGGEWILVRDLDEVELSELYEAVDLHIPIADARLPCHDDALGIRAKLAIDALRLPLRERMQCSVGSIFQSSIIDKPSLESPA